MFEWMEIDIPDDLLLKLTKQAHKLDITLNQHICNLLDKGMKKEGILYQAIEEIGREAKSEK